MVNFSGIVWGSKFSGRVGVCAGVRVWWCGYIIILLYIILYTIHYYYYITLYTIHYYYYIILLLYTILILFPSSSSILLYSFSSIPNLFPPSHPNIYSSLPPIPPLPPKYPTHPNHPHSFYTCRYLYILTYIPDSFIQFPSSSPHSKYHPAHFIGGMSRVV